MFEYEGTEHSLDELLEANSENSQLCHWLRSAPVGETFGEFTRVD
jgi:hypothetical protein